MKNLTKNHFSNLLKRFAKTLNSYVSTKDGQWTIKGFIDIYKNIYTISSDTKIVSKILELHIFPKLVHFAEENGFSIELASCQNYYPDLTFVSQKDPKVLFAVDLKTTYRNPDNREICNGFTLGSHGEYFINRTSSKNIQHPYAKYSGHFCLGIIYDRVEDSTLSETEINTIDNLSGIVSVIRNFQFFAEEKWKIASDKGGSGNTANIGSVKRIRDIVSGNGTFAKLGEQMFDAYWMNFGRITITTKDGKNKKITSLEEYLDYRGLEKKMRVIIPPIKCQGIKTKIVPKIFSMIRSEKYSRWVEPFVGSGVVAFNILPDKALLCDTNPHLIAFYSALQADVITEDSVRRYLSQEGHILREKGADYYYLVRDRFNSTHSPFDFLFLNRACFNGMMRFNRKGDFNVPFCRKTERFAQAYISKIAHQVENVRTIIKMKDFEFLCQDFRKTFSMLQKGDFVYCDPPYIDRYTDYFNSWNEKDEEDLLNTLSQLSVHFILSTWEGNEFRQNKYIERYSKKFHMDTQEHFYHIGAEIENRHSISEALFRNFTFQPTCLDLPKMEQPLLCL